MTSEDLEFDGVDGGKLAPMVARLLGREQVEVVEWQWAPLSYDVYLPGRRLVRFTGQARVGGYRGARPGGERRPWALVLKLLRPHERLTAREDEKWRREAQAYASGILSDLPGGLAAPRALAIDTMADGSVWLWLEQVADLYGGRWGFGQFRQAAYHLGEFNGAYLGQRPLPDYPWLVRVWTELHSETHKIPGALAEIEQLAPERPVRQVFPNHSPEEMTSLLRDQPLFKEALNRLPTLLCHHDASQGNLFARRVVDVPAQTVAAIETVGTVAIDWESIGYGAFGADIATLVFGTIRRGLFPADDVDALDRAVFDGYLAGLRAVGWSGRAESVRLGFAAAIALRWFQLHGVLHMLTNPAIRPFRGTRQESPEEARRQFILLTKYLLARTEEARRLMTKTELNCA
jgi:hypothetical protein